MKASELKLNNYVLFDGKIAEIIAVKIHPREDLVTLKYDYSDGKVFHCPTVEISRIEPIPLTEKILTNSGLKQLSEKKAHWYGEVNEMKMFIFVEEEDFYSSMFYIHKWCDTYYFSISTLDDGTESFERLAKIQYVHELQNIYSSLIGEELKIKL